MPMRRPVCPTVTGRVGTPPEHLHGVRTRDQRFYEKMVEVAQQRAEVILDKIADREMGELPDPDEWLHQLSPQVKGLVERFAWMR